VHPVNMGMDDVELAGLFGDGLEQRGTDGSRIRTRAAQAQGPGTDWDEFGSGAGVPARKQRDVSAKGAICAMRIVLFPTSIELGFRRLNTSRQGSFGSLLGRQSVTSTRNVKNRT
jgi:hypothetical protein